MFHGAGSFDGNIFFKDTDSNTTGVYRAQLVLKDAELNEITRDLAPGTQQVSGKVTFFTSLKGEGNHLSGLTGDGGISIRDADLYELPQIVKLLQILSIQEPDQAAFNSGLADFKVLGNRVRLDRVVLAGNTLTLFGNGWLTLEGKERIIDLTMSSRLGNTENQIPVISDVISGAGDQIAQIRIEGSLSDPVVRADRFPGIKKAWWSIFPEGAPTPTGNIPTERPRPIRDAWRKLTGNEKE